MADTIAGLGQIMQLAFVPRDVDAALDYWTKTIGAGPFFKLAHVDYKRFTYRGATATPDFTALIGYWGDIQIELIEQHCDTPTIYTAWRDAGQEGLHHVCLMVDSMAHARMVCTAAGVNVEQEIFLDSAEAIYVDAGGGPGTMVEILEPSPDFGVLFAMMRDAARGWDGNDPVRLLG